jgi:hypothetical protein
LFFTGKIQRYGPIQARGKSSGKIRESGHDFSFGVGQGEAGGFPVFSVAMVE